MTPTHIAVCAGCRRELICQEVGVVLERQVDGRTYYLIMADRYRCPGCGWNAYTEFGNRIMHDHPQFHEALAHHPARVVIG